MGKWILLLFSHLIFNNLIAQVKEKDSTSVESSSEDLLGKHIDFSHPASSLEAVLEKLSVEHNIKFSYSGDRIADISLSSKNYLSLPLATVLSSILRNTGFTYITVGTVIVIVPGEGKASLYETDTTTLTDSLEIEEYVYSPDKDLESLPRVVRKRIQEVYKEEQEWSEFRRKGGNDSLFRPSSWPLFELAHSNLYFSGSLGIIAYVPRFRSISRLPWKEDLQFKSKIKPTVRPEFSIGKVFGNFLVQAGLGYQVVNLEGYYTEEQPKSPNGQGQSKEIKTIVVFDKYSIISLPLEFLFYKQKKNFYAGVGSKIELDAVVGQISSEYFKKYLEEEGDGEKFSESFRKFSAATAIKAQAGLIITDNMSISTGLEYHKFLFPFYKNSLFRFKPNYLQLDFSMSYFFN